MSILKMYRSVKKRKKKTQLAIFNMLCFTFQMPLVLYVQLYNKGNLRYSYPTDIAPVLHCLKTESGESESKDTQQYLTSVSVCGAN